MGDFDEMANAHAQTRVKPPRQASPIRTVAAFGAVAAAVVIGLSIADPTLALSIRLIAGTGAGMAVAFLIDRLAGRRADRAAEAERQREHRAAEAEKQIAEMNREATRDGEGNEKC